MANYVLLERIELNASAASVTFANIPQTGYTDLKVVFSVREATGTSYTMGIRFNGTTTNYSRIDLRGNGSAASSGSATTFEPIVNSSGATASTFGNGEIYIPNYTSATNKSVSIDSTSENNATTSFLRMSAGLWSNTAAINQITFVPDTGDFAANSTFSLYGLAALGTTPVIAPKANGGNIIDYDGTYWIHTFLTSGTFTPATALTCDYLVVAGGAGGAWSGGGAGGLRSSVSPTGGGGSTESPLSLSLGTSYVVTIGAAGAGSASPATARGANGADSSIIGSVTSITSTGGGGGGGFGGSVPNGTGGNGGSSGGGGYDTAIRSAGTPTTNQGYSGGVTNAMTTGSGAGGGAGGTGGTPTNTNPPTVAGAGGVGVNNSITGTSVGYGGGGGGNSSSLTAGGGATQGGGAGGKYNAAGSNATVNTGGGGGGGYLNTGGNGGSGVVIIRYLA